jgi:hypothetical protein
LEGFSRYFRELIYRTPRVFTAVRLKLFPFSFIWRFFIPSSLSFCNVIFLGAFGTRESRIAGKILSPPLGRVGNVCVLLIIIQSWVWARKRTEKDNREGQS